MTRADLMRKALDALKYHTAQTRPIHETNLVIAEIQSSQAQAEGQGPVATLHQEGYWTWKITPPSDSIYAGWRMDVYAEPPAAQPDGQGPTTTICDDPVVCVVSTNATYGAEPAQQERKPEQCEWSPEDDEFMPGTYASSCGELWSFIDGGPKENRVRFCHGCGKPVFLGEKSHE